VTQWTTAGLAPDEQVSYWADVVCAAFTPLVPRRDGSHRTQSAAPDGVPGWVSASPLGSANTAEISSCTQLLTHGKTEVMRSQDEVLFVNLQLTGSCRAEQDGNRCIVQPGSFAVFDTTRPFSQEYRESDAGEPWRVLSFRIPREQWFDATKAPARVATPIDGAHGDGAAVANLMATLWAERRALSSQSATVMGRAFTDILASAVTAPSSPGVEPTLGQDRTEAVVVLTRRYIRAALPLGRVTATEAARRTSISVRSLHRAFQAHGLSFSECVREERFLGARRDLEVVEPHVCIADVAARWGYCDSSHLTRTFKQRLSCTPSDYRARHLNATAPSRRGEVTAVPASRRCIPFLFGST
jgi:AraC-like DNA-binding protein